LRLAVLAALRAWLRKRPADGSDYLFTSQKGGRLCRTQFFRNFQTVAQSAGLPAEKRHPHVLKHSLASHLVAGNANLALRQQLAVLKRRHPRPRLASFDKLFWVLARRFWSGWKRALIVVSPKTVVRWHRSGFALYWRAISKASRMVANPSTQTRTDHASQAEIRPRTLLFRYRIIFLANDRYNQLP
jgi:hypothetical protein